MAQENMKHLLVIRLSSMGDVAMTVPVLDCVLTQNKNVRITVVSRPLFAAFFSHLPRCDFFAADVDTKYKGFFGLLKLSKDLSALKPDFIADLHEVLRTNILDFLLKLKCSVPIKKIDKGRKEKKALCANNNEKVLVPLKSTFQRYADVFVALGFNIDLTKEYTINQPALLPKAERFLKNAEKQIPIGIAAFARYAGKTYPEYQMKGTIDELFKIKPELHIFLFGGKSEQIELELRKKEHPDKITIVAGQLSLEEEMGLISRMKLMLSMDSANMHIASMLSVPVVSLWGATHPYLGFYGWHQDPENALYADRKKYPNLPSSVNGKKMHPGTEMCMNSISPEQVVEKIIKILKD